jgi:hypothetical protein
MDLHWKTPLKNMSSSVGVMKIPIEGKIKNVPNHKPDKGCAMLCCTVVLYHIRKPYSHTTP